jgi:hypothetical protein
VAGLKRGGSLAVVFLVIFCLSPVAAQPPGKVVVVAMNRTSLSQVAADKAMASWLTRGSVGLLNISTAARPLPSHLYVTMGAGSRAIGADSARLAFMTDEENNGTAAGEAFWRRSAVAPEGEILHLGMAEINRLNQELRHPVQPGLLGDTLRQNGRVAAVIGNADGLLVSREAVTFLADGSGQVPLGEVSRRILKRDSAFPFGWRTDREKVWNIFQEVFDKVDVVLVEWGDFSRLDEYRPLMAAAPAFAREQEIFQDLSWFLERVSARLSPADLLLLVSPLSPAGERGRFGYMVAIGGQFPPGALLSSDTTRRPGLAAITDIAPTILAEQGLRVPPAMLGMPVSAGKYGGPSALLEMEKEIGRIFQLRVPLLRGYVFLQIVIVLGALINLFARFIPFNRFEALLLALLTVPPLLLILPLQLLSPEAGFLLASFAVVITVALLQKFVKGQVSQFAVLALSTSALIAGDLLRGAELMKVSVLGYDPVSGARYYGLGNEYMGVLVGSSVLGFAAVITLWPRFKRLFSVLTAAYFLGGVLLIVAPGGGANFGGMVTALTAFLVTLALLWQIRPSWFSAVVVLVLLIAITASALFINLRLPHTEQSHLGRTITLFQEDGWQVLQDAVSRKAEMNSRLFRYSLWSRAFLVFLVMLAVLFYRPRGILHDLQKRFPQLSAGFWGIIFGSVAAFLFNDSGVVAAATTLLYAGVPIIILAGRIVGQMPENSRNHR